MSSQLRLFYHRHQPFLTLLLLFTAFRLMALLLLRTGGLIADASDYDYYAAWGELSAMGYRTFENLWSTYPPLFPALMLPVHELASRIPPWTDPRLWFHVLFGIELLLFECGNLILIYRLAQKLQTGDWRLETEPGLQSPVLYALLFTPVYSLLGWFEAMPLFFLLLGLDLLLSSHRWGWIGSAVAAALGVLTKLTPAMLVPVAIRWLGGRLSWQAVKTEWFNPRSAGNLLRPALYVALFAGVVAGLGYWLVGGHLTYALSSLRVNAIRPPWESIWALLDGYYGFGLVPVDIRNLPGIEREHWQSSLPWTWISVGFGLAYLWLYTRRYDWRRPRTAVAFTGISMIGLLLYSKGWSPQFLVLVLAFVVLLLPTWRGMVIASVLSLANVVEAYVFLVLLPEEHWLLVGTVLLRTTLLIILMVDFLAQIWPGATVAAQMARVNARLSWGAVGIALLATLLAAPRAAQAYNARRLAEHPCREAVTYLQAQVGAGPRLIISDQLDIWREFYPWLHHDYTIRVIDGYNPDDRPWPDVIAERLADVAGNQEFWWLVRSDRPTQAGEYFAQPAVRNLGEQQLGACLLQRVART